jgi:hypothetical protein
VVNDRWGIGDTCVNGACVARALVVGPTGIHAAAALPATSPTLDEMGPLETLEALQHVLKFRWLDTAHNIVRFCPVTLH